MSQLQTRIDDEQVLSLQQQKKIKELQVKARSLPASARLALPRFAFLVVAELFFSFSSLPQQQATTVGLFLLFLK